MTLYLYMARIMTDTSNAFGFNNTQEAADKLDFETNFKSQTLAVDDLENMETTFITRLSYTQFKAKIDGVNILWTDVKLETTAIFYDLYLLTTSPI